MNRMHIELQDQEHIDLGDQTLFTDFNLFNMERKMTLSHEWRDSVWITVWIEMNLDLLKYERRVSTLSDLMSDVGGFFGLLIMFGSVFSKLWNFNSFENYLVSRLYKIKKPSEKLTDGTAYFDKSDFVKKSVIP